MNKGERYILYTKKYPILIYQEKGIYNIMIDYVHGCLFTNYFVNMPDRS